MRFFSNDARESSDDQVTDERAEARADEDRPERVQSDPVAVPSQRPPSPWSNTPATADDTVAVDPERRDGSPDAVPDRDDAGAPPFHEPSPQPTAFGASTVGGAVAASAMANPENDRWQATDRDSAADSGVGDDANVAPGDGVVTSSTNTYAGSTADTERTDPDAVVDVPLDDDDDTDTRPGAVSDRTADAGLADTTDTTDRDHDGNRDESVTTYDETDTPASGTLKDDGGFDDPRAVEPGTERPLDDSTLDDDARPEPAASALKDEGSFDDPQVVEPATGAPVDADDRPAQDPDDRPAAEATPAVVAVPVAAATTPAAPAETLFDRGDAQAFQERWRDVQLRFVDSPKDAAAEAAGLVEEAVEKLTAGLRAQREGLHSDTDDTEQLRVQLRGYRDMLNRILSL
ncbi:hypothetical protein GCM10020358_48370 [Amorphoplanes nipponensis]|uniref:Uncharacterized protein n=1 Tax=Actinoplanes nipponensis TaxID=135950 RepID=A0A919JNK3_9ACTN|nr:hypothetical protein [Actinoplanes nipponensis]GIE52570.1 hypothetical protein Ani05nite_61040 [Actinoplanes nipponensis]